MTKLFDKIFANHSRTFLFLACIVCLLAVILFLLALHMYTKSLLAQARHERRRSLSRSHFPSANSLTVDTTLSASPTKGLEASAIASIPLFVYDSSAGRKSGLECVVCLALFEDKEMGKRLPDCGHGFHVDCIDMWLTSHSSCPICRVGVRVGVEGKVVDIDSMSNSVVNEDSASDIVVDMNGVEVLSHSSSALCYSGVEGLSNLSSARVSLSARLSVSTCLSSSSLSSQIAAMGGSLMKLMSRNA